MATGEDEDTGEVTTKTFSKARNEHETAETMRAKLARQVLRAKRPLPDTRRKDLNLKLEQQKRHKKREAAAAGLQTFKTETSKKFRPGTGQENDKPAAKPAAMPAAKPAAAVPKPAAKKPAAKKPAANKKPAAAA